MRSNMAPENMQVALHCRGIAPTLRLGVFARTFPLCRGYTSRVTSFHTTLFCVGFALTFGGCGDADTGDPPTVSTPPPAETRNTHAQYSPTVIDTKIAALDTGDARQRAMAVMSLPTDSRHFEKHPELLAKVRDVLLAVATNDAGASNRAVAIGKLLGMGEHAVPVMPRLIELLDHPTDCQPFCHNLRRMGRHGLAALPRMIELLKVGDDRNRIRIINAVGHFGADAAPAVDTLTEILRSHKSSLTRLKAARALGQIGAPAKGALPLLDELSASGSGSLKFACKDAADRIRKAG